MFKVGDKVICIDNNGNSWLSLGDIDIVAGVDGIFLTLERFNVGGVDNWFKSDRFELVGESKVVHPSHYNQGKIECWDYIIDHGMGFLAGNVVKYVTRYADKNGLEDLKKAKEYLDKLIEVEEGNNER